MSIILYALCLLYILSTASMVTDVVTLVLKVSNTLSVRISFFLSVMQDPITTLSIQLQIDSESVPFQLYIIQTVASGCCDFLAQCILVRINHCRGSYYPFNSCKSSKIYRCWIVWGQNIFVVAIPLFLAIAYIGQSIYLHLISRFRYIASSYLGSDTWRNNKCRRPYIYCYLGDHIVYNKFRPIHSREYSGDRFDRVQDPQGVLGCQGC